MKRHEHPADPRRPGSRLGLAAGSLVVLAWLSLLSPGVRVVRADPPADASGAVAEAPSCKVPAAVDRSPRAVRALELFRRGTEPGPVAGRPDVVVLNGRGYNYRSAQGLETDRLRFEAARERRAGH